MAWEAGALHKSTAMTHLHLESVMQLAAKSMQPDNVHEIFQAKSIVGRIYEEKILNRTQQLSFCKIVFQSQTLYYILYIQMTIFKGTLTH